MGSHVSLRDTTRNIVVIRVQISQTEKTIEIQLVRPTMPEYAVKYKVRKMAKSLLKHHCYCRLLLMWTTKTAVCLQTKAIFHHLYGF